MDIFFKYNIVVSGFRLQLAPFHSGGYNDAYVFWFHGYCMAIFMVIVILVLFNGDHDGDVVVI